MRQLGKCDSCRQRKVKCDEKRPLCGGCSKGNRSCRYSYSHSHDSFTLVMQDPSQMTRYGRSMGRPVMYPLVSSQSDQCLTPNSASTSAPGINAQPPSSSVLQLRGGMVASDGRGFFQTLAPIRMKPEKVSRKAEAYQKRRCQEHLLRLQREMALASHRPISPDTKLTTMFVNILRANSAQHQQIYTLGNWVSSIPSRIGSSLVVTMAAEFFIHSFEAHRVRTHTNQTLALKAKGEALKELQLTLLVSQQRPTYDLVLATKLHYAAEVLLGVANMHYAIHTLGLMDLLKLGAPPDADEEHFWDMLGNTYFDDITMAMTAGRPSIYDNDFYLTLTHPANLAVRTLSKRQEVTMAIMHILIQCPRLIAATRHAIREPHNVVAAATAISLAEKLWKLTGTSYFAEYINEAVTIANDAITGPVAEILLHGYHFENPQTMVICSRYWFLQVMLCGIMDTLDRRFPEYAYSLLPDPDAVHKMDADAAKHIARVVLGLGDDIAPLTLICTHGPLSASIGAWHRQIRYLDMHYPILGAESLNAAQAMKKWLLTHCNLILKRLKISGVDEGAWLEALDCMAGEELPEWIPSKVSFGDEDGEMVMKLEYSDLTANGDLRVHGGGGGTRVFNVRNPANFGPQHLRRWVKGTGGPDSA